MYLGLYGVLVYLGLGGCADVPWIEGLLMYLGLGGADVPWIVGEC